MPVHIGEIITSVELDGGRRGSHERSLDPRATDRLVCELEEELLERLTDRIIEALEERGER